MWEFWLLLIILFLIIWLQSDHLSCFLSALASFLALLISLSTYHLLPQILTFTFSFLLLCCLLRFFPLPIHTLHLQTCKDLSQLIGKRGTVTRFIGKNFLQSGFIQLDGENWCALSYQHQPISSGQAVEVKAVHGLYLVVIPIS